MKWIRVFYVYVTQRCQSLAGSGQRNDPDAGNVAKITFVVRTDEHSVIQMPSGRGDGEIVGWKRSTSPAKCREKFRPSSRYSGIEIDNTGDFDERLDSCPSAGREFPVADKSDANKQLSRRASVEAVIRVLMYVFYMIYVNVPSNVLSTCFAMTLAAIKARLRDGTVTSRQLVEKALAAIKDPHGEGARTFLRVHEDESLAAGDLADAELRSGRNAGPLCGIPISIKDLFDEAGVVTTGGSTFLADTAPATRDSSVVERLKKAGAIIIGRTNLTEFAYSALGINPHYGTPKNTFDRAAGRIPGGSTSGGAISVTDGMAAAAIGTDTGGSVRIPAALNGLVGFKPTANRVPRDGVLPLSFTLDSVGPIAKSVEDCVLLDVILSGQPSSPSRKGVSGLSFAVPQSVVLDDLSSAVARAFETAISRLSAAGAKIIDVPIKEFARARDVNPRGAISSYESWAFHRAWIQGHRDEYDPRVLARILPGEQISRSMYEGVLESRKNFVNDVNSAAQGYDAMLMPTTPDTAPTIAEATKDDDSYFRINSRMLRNPAMVNLFDGCALSIPCHEPGAAPVGLMVAATHNADRHILNFGGAVAKIVFPEPVDSEPF